MVDRFKSASSQQSVSTLTKRINDKDEKIILNPAYQRDVVWEQANMGFFINSVLCGIVPNNIIFNQNGDGNFICIDGKQRLTSLDRFKKNEIPAIFQHDDKDVHAYYDVLPKKSEQKIQYIYRTLSQEEKNKFNHLLVNVVTYDELSYEDQIDIFNRIQHGKILSSGEKMSAFFSKDDIMKKFTEFCTGKQLLLQKYIKSAKRKEAVPHIVLIMYIINKNVRKPPDPKQKEMYLKSIDNMTKLTINLKKIDTLIDICYGPNLFGHNSITSKLQQNIRLMALYLVNSLFANKLTAITDLQFKYLRSAVKKTYRDMTEGYSKIIVTKTDIKTIESIYTLMSKYYGDLLKKNCEISQEDEVSMAEEEEQDESAEMSEEEPEDEVNMTESSEEVIIVPPKIIKKVVIVPVKKPIVNRRK